MALLFVCMAIIFENRSQQQLMKQLALEAEGLRNGFEMSRKDLELQMLTLASLLAENTRIQTLFSQGVKVLRQEGGGAGLDETSFWRDALHLYLDSRWQLMQSEYGLRQLQFLVSPGVTSFLRVHDPGSFGDQMSGIRPIIEDVLNDQQYRSGFETGRIYSGIRGVVPVWFNPPGKPREFIGVLEAGTSFDQQLLRLDQQYDAGFAVLLRRDHVEQQVWQQHQHRNGLQLPDTCSCYIEASSRPEIVEWLSQEIFPAYTDQTLQSALVKSATQTLHVMRFPLSDYAGLREQGQPVGSVWIWQDKSALVAGIQLDQLRNRVLLLLVYLVALGLLLRLLHLTRRRLQWRIDQAVAQQLATAQALEASEQRYENALGAINDGLWEADLHTGQLHWDQRCFSMLGYAETRALCVDDWYAQIHPDDLHYVQEVIQEHLLNHQPYRIEYRSRCADGGWLWLEGRGKVTQWHNDEPWIMTGTVTDISARKHAENELRRLSVTDSLTGLYNRRYFFKRLSALLSACQRNHRPVAVVMLDIDHFKQVNDQYGHACGDQVLCEVSVRIQSLLRQADVLARLGGEEFAILLADTETDGALELAERIRVAVSAQLIRIDEQELTVTLSMGVSQVQRSDLSADAVMHRADSALYRAKHAGRNCVMTDSIQSESVQ